MRERGWRVAVLDSGISPLPPAGLGRIRRFIDEGERVLEGEPVEDPIGHGTMVADIIGAAAGRVRLLVGQVLNERGRSTAAVLAAAIGWALSQRAQLLHFSLGLSADRTVLRAAIGEAVAAGVLVVAAAPARGRITYPAFYPGVIRATGDARCDDAQISYLGTAAADFGACALYRSRSGQATRGASVGAAYLSRHIVTHLAPGLAAPQAHAALVRRATFLGPERHRSAARA